MYRLPYFQGEELGESSIEAGAALDVDRVGAVVELDTVRHAVRSACEENWEKLQTILNSYFLHASYFLHVAGGMGGGGVEFNSVHLPLLWSSLIRHSLKY